MAEDPDRNEPTRTIEEQKKPKRPWKPKRSKYDIELEPWEQKIAEAIYTGKPLLGVVELTHTPLLLQGRPAIGG